MLRDTNEALEQITIKYLQIGALQQQQGDYLLSTARNMNTGRFRVRLKIHKQPVKGRPLCNMRNCTAEHIGIFLHETLQPHINKYRTVLTSTDSLIQQIEGIRIPEGFFLRTADVCDLFPSINRNEMMPIFDRLFQEMLPDALARLCLRLTHLLVSGTVLEHASEHWLAASGLPTGSSASCTLANLLLVDLDRHVQDALQDQVLMLRRFIDDIFVIDSAEDASFSAACNSWMSGIATEPTGNTRHDKEVIFLDLAISHHAGSIRFRLHENPLAQYLYVPWGSSHSTSIKLGIAIAGLIRISRRFSRDTPASEISDARNRFLARLRARGFPASALRVAQARVSTRRRQAGKGVQIRCRISMHKRANSLCAALRSSTRCQPSRITPKTLFTAHYKRTWQPEHRRVGRRDLKFFRDARSSVC